MLIWTFRYKVRIGLHNALSLGWKCTHTCVVSFSTTVSNRVLVNSQGCLAATTVFLYVYLSLPPWAAVLLLCNVVLFLISRYAPAFRIHILFLLLCFALVYADSKMLCRVCYFFFFFFLWSGYSHVSQFFLRIKMNVDMVTIFALCVCLLNNESRCWQRHQGHCQILCAWKLYANGAL